MVDAGVNKIHPKVRDLPISGERRTYIINEFLNVFRRTAISRTLVNQQKIDSDENILTLGFNFILDRIWFVDYVGEEGYAYQNLGGEYGRGLAFSENKMILTTFLEERNVRENIVLRSFFDEVSIDNAITTLENRGLTCESIVTNVHDVMSFWWYKPFKGLSKSDPKVLHGHEGYYKNIPVFWSNSIPDKTTLFINRNVGDLLIFNDLTADISDIGEKEFEEIIKNIPTLTKDDLYEKVRFSAKERIRFTLKDKNAFVVLESKETSNTSN
jgi:hypothetical protein